MEACPICSMPVSENEPSTDAYKNDYETYYFINCYRCGEYSIHKDELNAIDTYLKNDQQKVNLSSYLFENQNYQIIGDNIEKISMYIFDFEIYAKSKNLKKIILISTMSWICLFVYMYTVFQMLQIPASLSMVTFLTLLMSFVYLIPVNVLGGLGIVDVTWVGLLILCGIGRNDAIQSAIALRMVSYLNSLLLVCISFIILRWTENNV